MSRANSQSWTPRWARTTNLNRQKLLRWVVALVAFTIANALVISTWNGLSSGDEEGFLALADLSITGGCPARFANLTDPEYEIDANTGEVFLPDENFVLTRLPQWDHLEGQAFYTTMSNVFITGHSLKAYNCRAVYFEGGCNLFPDPYPIEELRQIDQKQITHIDRAVIISQHFGYAYYHWLIEALPRLIMLYDMIQADKSLKLIMFETEVPDVGPTILRLLDIDPNRVVWYHAENVYYAKEVIMPSPAQCGKALSTAIVALKDTLRAKLMEKYPKKFNIKEKAKMPFTILVQDRGTARRSLVNHHELVHAITAANEDARVIEFGPKEGFLSMARKHFYADIVVGPHGAGLSNVIFAPDDAVMVEIHPNEGNQYDEGPHYVNSCHQRTARRTGLRSFLLLEDNGDVAYPFFANVSRVVDTISKVRTGDFERIDQYISWQL